MQFNNHFLLLNHIILNYNDINDDLILKDIQLKKENGIDLLQEA
jgi:response regulator of citrate/malate metabolism